MPGNFPQQTRHAARMMEVLHIVLACRLQIHEHRNLAPDLIECVEVDRNAPSTGDR